MREQAAQRVEWRKREGSESAPPVAVKILAINDFHGQLTGRSIGGRPVGSAAVLASYLEQGQAAVPENQAFIVHAGDQVGVSPPASALLQDEPAISFLNLLANQHCRVKLHPHCNLVGTVGNHEFDKGRDEMLRMVRGGNSPAGPFLENPYRGAGFPYVAANVVDARTGLPILPPFVIKEVHGVPIAFIGVALKDTPTIVIPSGVASLRFLDEADTINFYVRLLKAINVHAFVALIHQGGQQTSVSGPTPTGAVVTGPIVDIVSRLDDDVDVVVSGHTHTFTNALLPNQHGRQILVTQAFSSGTSYSDIDLMLDPATKDVVAKSASIVTTFADAGPGLTPDPQAAALVHRAEDAVAPLVNRVIGQARIDILRVPNAAGETPMGNLVADAHRAATGTDFAFTNQGGIRADFLAGPVTWGQAFGVQPFGHNLVTMHLTGQQLYDLLNQQWINQPFPRIMQISGLTYTWDNNASVGNRIIEIRRNGVAIDRFATYSVTVSAFLAAGGENFSVLTLGTDRLVSDTDLNALIFYIQSLAQPFSAAIEGRIERLN